jgi:hypothetical protein
MIKKSILLIDENIIRDTTVATTKTDASQMRLHFISGHFFLTLCFNLFPKLFLINNFQKKENQTTKNPTQNCINIIRHKILYR